MTLNELLNDVANSLSKVDEQECSITVWDIIIDARENIEEAIKRIKYLYYHDGEQK